MIPDKNDGRTIEITGDDVPGENPKIVETTEKTVEIVTEKPVVEQTPANQPNVKHNT